MDFICINLDRRSLSLTFDLLLDRFGRIEPMRDVVWIGVLKAEVVLLDEVQVKEHVLEQLLSGGLFLKKRVGNPFIFALN